jgi:RNA polymerase sigma-70 factor (ECF subfamily)
VVYGDSGGTPPSWPRPIEGRDNVARLMLGLSDQIRQVGAVPSVHEINGQPGALVHDRDGRLVNAFSFDIVDGVVYTVRSVINPDKLGHLGPLTDLEELRSQVRRAPQ